MKKFFFESQKSLLSYTTYIQHQFIFKIDYNSRRENQIKRTTLEKTNENSKRTFRKLSNDDSFKIF